MGLRRRFGLSERTVISRRGIRWSLDLTEGVDFAIFLFGVWEPSTAKVCARFLTEGAIAIDIGANVGGHTLPMARSVGPGGRVLAFEPTDFAVGKLRANVALNEQLAPVVSVEKMALSSLDRGRAEPVYASWSLFSKTEGRRHPLHRGVAKETSDAPVRSLDGYLGDNAIDRLDLVKIDVDGGDYLVLLGATQTVQRFRPVIVIELAPYLLKEKGSSIEELWHWFDEKRYVLLEEKTLSALSFPTIASIPVGASINAVALPAERAAALVSRS